MVRMKEWKARCEWEELGVCSAVSGGRGLLGAQLVCMFGDEVESGLPSYAQHLLLADGWRLGWVQGCHQPSSSACWLHVFL